VTLAKTPDQAETSFKILKVEREFRQRGGTL